MLLCPILKLPHRELNPDLVGESDVSLPLDHGGFEGVKQIGGFCLSRVSLVFPNVISLSQCQCCQINETSQLIKFKERCCCSQLVRTVSSDVRMRKNHLALSTRPHSLICPLYELFSRPAALAPEKSVADWRRRVSIG